MHTTQILSDEKKKYIVILIVDDDDLVLQTLNLIVSSFGYQCLTATNGVEALKMLKSYPCDLVISDVVMPEMDGLELLDRIKKEHPNTDVIMATGFSEEANYAKVISAGAIDFIKKPIEKAELEAKLARALREQSLVQKLEQLSLSDSLTNLANRRAFSKRFAKEVERASRMEYSLFLAILDIDNFKTYNDSFGHQAGDKVLIALANILQEDTRNSVDLTFRLGGDEFAILLPQTSSEQAIEILHRIISSYRDHNFGSTTLSVGISSCLRNDKISWSQDEEQMIERADQAMYKAKSGGKDCVVFL